MATQESSAIAQTTLDLKERVQAIKERSTRGLFAYNRGDVLRLIGDEWAVRSSRGGYWLVDLAEETCPCEDFTHFGREHDVPCKHIYAVAIAHATRRGNVREVRTLRVVAGDPFRAAGKRREDSFCACVGGWVYLGIEEDGDERTEAVRCRRCNR
jgi:hypothetical protein